MSFLTKLCNRLTGRRTVADSVPPKLDMRQCAAIEATVTELQRRLDVATDCRIDESAQAIMPADMPASLSPLSVNGVTDEDTSDGSIDPTGVSLMAYVNDEKTEEPTPCMQELQKALLAEEVEQRIALCDELHTAITGCVDEALWRAAAAAEAAAERSAALAEERKQLQQEMADIVAQMSHAE